MISTSYTVPSQTLSRPPPNRVVFQLHIIPSLLTAARMLVGGGPPLEYGPSTMATLRREFPPHAGLQMK